MNGKRVDENGTAGGCRRGDVRDSEDPEEKIEKTAQGTVEEGVLW